MRSGGAGCVIAGVARRSVRAEGGATDMIYKPEHVSDLESGAIVEAEVRPGDAADNDDTMAQRVLCAVGTLVEVVSDPAEHEHLGETVTGDEGFFALQQIAQLHQSGVRTVIADPQARRRRQDPPTEDGKTLRRAARATASFSGKALLRKRGEHLERGFAHVLDHGGLRRATLRGCENLTKRHLVAALTFNLSLLLRTIFGVGTAKQWLAGAAAALLVALCALWRLLDAFFTSRHRRMNRPPSDPTPSFHLYPKCPTFAV